MSVPLLVLAAAIAGGPVASQTAAPSKPSSNASDTRPATSEAASKASVEGCVITGKEAGRKPDLAEKTGLDEHFVLAAAKVVRGTPPNVTSGAPGALPEPMFKISGLTDEQLKIHVGRRVRIEGRFGGLEQPSPSPETAPQDNLVELNVATIRQVPGDCAVPKS